MEDILTSDHWSVLDRDVDTFLTAIDLTSKYHVHLWDTLIAACMKENDLTEIVTENKKDFEKIPDIEVMVPF